MDARLFRAMAAVTLLLAAAPATAQSVSPSEGGGYRLTRVRVAAGTTETAATRYRLNATVGQPEASETASPRYRLRGGFWGAASGPGEASLFSDGFEG